MRALRIKLAVGVAVLGAAGVGTVAIAGDRPGVRASLAGYEEVPAVSTNGGGTFRARIAKEGDAMAYELSYGQLSGPVQQAHIHFGQRSVNGGVSVFLCSNLPAAPAGTPACPTPQGSVSGTLLADDVIGPTGQGIAAGEFAELVRAIRAGVAYVNVHTDPHPGGEIRGQLPRSGWH